MLGTVNPVHIATKSSVSRARTSSRGKTDRKVTFQASTRHVTSPATSPVPDDVTFNPLMTSLASTSRNGSSYGVAAPHTQNLRLFGADGGGGGGGGRGRGGEGGMRNSGMSVDYGFSTGTYPHNSSGYDTAASHQRSQSAVPWSGHHSHARPPSPSQPLLGLRRKQRPKTTSATSRPHKRPLGAQLYPVLQPNDLDRERSLFRSGVGVLSSLFGSTLRSQSARWRAMGGGGGRGGRGEEDYFCRASRAEASMNNANLAKVFHVVPQRVVSARGSSRGDPQGGAVTTTPNLTLHRLNLPTSAFCNRRASLNKAIASSNNSSRTFSHGGTESAGAGMFLKGETDKLTLAIKNGITTSITDNSNNNDFSDMNNNSCIGHNSTDGDRNINTKASPTTASSELGEQPSCNIPHPTTEQERRLANGEPPSFSQVEETVENDCDKQKDTITGSGELSHGPAGLQDQQQDIRTDGEPGSGQLSQASGFLQTREQAIQPNAYAQQDNRSEQSQHQSANSDGVQRDMDAEQSESSISAQAEQQAKQHQDQQVDSIDEHSQASTFSANRNQEGSAIEKPRSSRSINADQDGKQRPRGLQEKRYSGSSQSSTFKSTSIHETLSNGRPLSSSFLQAQYLAMRGVDPLGEHSAEWLEETRLKQEESVAILTEQLKSMLIGDEGEEEDGREGGAAAARNAENLQRLNNIDQSFPLQRVAVNGQGVTLKQCQGHREEGRVQECSKEGRDSSEPGGEGRVPEGPGGSDVERLCMKTVSCEVLGPYSCYDCTKLRLHEKQRQEQTALYPGLTVDPRTLVAPDRLRRLTASLPPPLLHTGQRVTLQCGCVVSVHRDFLFPVIVTDHEIQTRLMTAQNVTSSKVTSPKDNEKGKGEGSFSQFSGKRSGRKGSGTKKGSAGRRGGEEKGNRREDFSGFKWEREKEEEKTMSPTDMKVTVRYTTPPTDKKGESVFITDTASPEPGGAF